MLPASHRLRTKEVAEVLKRGLAAPSGKYLSAKALFMPNDATIRSAAVVSRKVARTASERNRVRRAAYDAIGSVTNNKQQTTHNKAANLVVFVRSIPENNLRTFFARDIEKILSALG